MREQRTENEQAIRPLDGIRVLEYGIFHAGPGASAILGDLGAEVIKVESGEGDPERTWTKIWQLDLSLPTGESLMFHASNRNKKGVYLDIETEGGREVIHKLIKASDVFLTNLRKSTKVKMGLDYATLSRINPRIIHASVSGYGPEGPMDDLGAFDPMGLARSGMMYVAGNRDPVLIHIAILDQATAIAASHGILTALLVRERFGIGQEVHASLFGTGLWLSYANLLISNILSVNPTVGASRLEHSPLRNFFCCNDGKWIIGAHHPEAKYWPVFCEATGQKNLAVDCRFVSEEARADNCSELVSHFDKVFASKPREEWMEIFVSRGLMFCPIQHVTEIKDDPQAFANDYVIDFEDPILGKLRIPGYPIHFSKTRAATHSLGPSLGQHTELVLREVGYTDQEINDLKRAGVIR